MIRQYRHAVSDFLWELVAGRIEPGESLASGARRELLEEAGYTARKMRKLLEFLPSPGMLSERMFIFLATGLTAGTAQPEEDEQIEPERFSLRADRKEDPSEAKYATANRWPGFFTTRASRGDNSSSESNQRKTISLPSRADPQDATIAAHIAPSTNALVPSINASFATQILCSSRAHPDCDMLRALNYT